MLDWIESLSLLEGAIVLAVACALLAFFVFARIRRSAFAWACALVAPLVLAPLLYWTPVWNGADADEYRTWIAVVLVPWWVAGLVASCLTLALARRHRRKRSRRR
jgi:ABC-type branched-subunit amino acid transport system permease subunit